MRLVSRHLRPQRPVSAALRHTSQSTCCSSPHRACRTISYLPATPNHLLLPLCAPSAPLCAPLRPGLPQHHQSSTGQKHGERRGGGRGALAGSTGPRQPVAPRAPSATAIDPGELRATKAAAAAPERRLPTPAAGAVRDGLGGPEKPRRSRVPEGAHICSTS